VQRLFTATKGCDAGCISQGDGVYPLRSVWVAMAGFAGPNDTYGVKKKHPVFGRNIRNPAR